MCRNRYHIVVWSINKHSHCYWPIIVKWMFITNCKNNFYTPIFTTLPLWSIISAVLLNCMEMNNSFNSIEIIRTKLRDEVKMDLLTIDSTYFIPATLHVNDYKIKRKNWDKVSTNHRLPIRIWRSTEQSVFKVWLMLFWKWRRIVLHILSCSF
jgi:hypothetical protein